MFEVFLFAKTNHAWQRTIFFVAFFQGRIEIQPNSKLKFHSTVICFTFIRTTCRDVFWGIRGSFQRFFFKRLFGASCLFENMTQINCWWQLQVFSAVSVERTPRITSPLFWRIFLVCWCFSIDNRKQRSHKACGCSTQFGPVWLFCLRVCLLRMWWWMSPRNHEV